MRAHTPPYTTKTAKQLYDEAGVIAAEQDAKLDPGNDALPSILADFRAVVKRLEAYALRLREKRGNGLPAESTYLASFGPNGGGRASRIISPAERAHLQGRLSPAQCRAYGIGDVAETATTVASQHPAHAEAIRINDERLNGPEDHL